jgi:hypothetical protein
MKNQTLLRATTFELLAEFRASSFMSIGKRFSLAEIAADLNITKPRAGQLARHLLDEGLLTRGLDGESVFFVRRTRNCLAYGRWRKLSNQQLGIDGDKPLGQAGH